MTQTPSLYKKNLSIFSIHLLAWITYSFLLTWMRDGFKKPLFLAIAYYITLVMIFYIHALFIMPKYFETKRYEWGVVMILLNLLFFYLTIELRRVLFFNFVSNTQQLPQISFRYINIFIVHCAYATVYWLYYYLKKREQQLLNLQKKYFQQELASLKEQINQHFLYNTLSLFYVEALAFSKPIADSLLSLSELLRYSIAYEADSFIALNQEITYSEILIRLNQERFGQTAKVAMSVEGNAEGFLLPHMTILSLIEAAYHYNTQKISLAFRINSDALKVSLRQAKNKNTSNTINLENLEQRLKLLCPSKFSITIQEEKNNYFVHLELLNSKQHVKMPHH